MPRIMCRKCDEPLAVVELSVWTKLDELGLTNSFECPGSHRGNMPASCGHDEAPGNGEDCPRCMALDDETFTPDTVPDDPCCKVYGKPYTERDAQELSLPWDNQSANPDYPE